MSGSYRYIGSTWYRNGGVVEHGDTVSPTDAEKAAFGDVLEPVTQTADDEADDGEDDVVTAESFDCGAETSDGGTCSRDVDAPDDRCWAHTED